MRAGELANGASKLHNKGNAFKIVFSTGIHSHVTARLFRLAEQMCHG